MRARVERWIIRAAWFKDSEGNLLAIGQPILSASA